MRHLLHSWRSLRTAPAHVLGVVSSVTVGLTLSLVAWQVVTGLVYGDLPGIRERHRIARLHLQHTATTATESVAGRQVASVPWTAADVQALTAFGAPGVASVGAEGVTTATVRAGTLTRRQQVAHTTARYFDTLGTTAAIGRLLRDDDQSQPVAVLGYGLWQALGEPAAIVGTIVTVDDAPYTIVGVAPKNFGGLRIRDIGDGPLAGPQVWVPLAADMPLQAFARLHTGSFAGTIGEALRGLAAGLEQVQPGTRPGLTIEGQSLGLDPAERPGAAMAAVALFMTLPLAVLGLAMINVVNLQLARITDAMHIVRVQLSLGASPAQATSWLFAEAVVLSSLSAGFALLVLRSVIPALQAQAPFVASVSAQAFTVAAALALIVVVLAGWLPSWLVARRVAASGPRIAMAPASRLRRGLVVVQVGAAVALVFVTSLCVRSVTIAMASLASGAERTGFVAVPGPLATRWVEEIGRRSETEAAAVATFLPQGGRMQFGAPDVENAAMRTADGGRVGPGWIAAMGARVVAGQWPAADTDAVVVTDGVASQLAASLTEAVGLPLRVAEGTDNRVRTIAAVVVLPYRGPGGRSPQALYVVSNGPWIDTATAVVRGRSELPGARQIQQVFATVQAPDAAVQVTSLATIVSAGLVDVQLLGGTFSVLGTGALLLAMSGVLALLLVLVRTRRREFAIRAALGASAPALMRVVGREVVRILIGGTALGLLLGAGGVALLRSQIANTSPTDPLAILITAMALLVGTGGAALVPVVRAAHVPPVEALRG